MFGGHELRSPARKRLVADFPSPGVHLDGDGETLDRVLVGWYRWLPARAVAARKGTRLGYGVPEGLLLQEVFRPVLDDSGLLSDTLDLAVAPKTARIHPRSKEANQLLQTYKTSNIVFCRL